MAKKKVETTEVVKNTVEQVIEDVTAPVVLTGVVALPKEYDKLNVRKAPNINSKVVATVNERTKFNVKRLNHDPEWVKVTKDGITGYCMTKYLEIAE